MISKTRATERFGRALLLILIFLGLAISRPPELQALGVEMPFELFKDVPYMRAKALLLAGSFHGEQTLTGTPRCPQTSRLAAELFRSPYTVR
jgi:hypothetical protein